MCIVIWLVTHNQWKLLGLKHFCEWLFQQLFFCLVFNMQDEGDGTTFTAVNQL